MPQPLRERRAFGLGRRALQCQRLREGRLEDGPHRFPSASGDVATMSQSHNEHEQLAIFDRVDDAIVADSNAPQLIRALQLDGSRRSGISSETSHRQNDPTLNLLRQFLESPFGTRLERDFVFHRYLLPVTR